MATKITYTKAQKDKLKDFGWSSRGHQHGAFRAIKMLRPVCYECSSQPGRFRNWVKDCVHDPYWRLQPKEIKVPVYITDEDGDMVLDEVATNKGKKVKMLRFPNIVEVPLATNINAGEGVTRATQKKQFRYLEEEDVAPICQMWGCGASWPTVGTEGFGDYCSENHAKLCAAHEQGIILPSNDPAAMRRTLADIAI